MHDLIENKPTNTRYKRQSLLEPLPRKLFVLLLADDAALWSVCQLMLLSLERTVGEREAR